MSTGLHSLSDHSRAHDSAHVCRPRQFSHLWGPVIPESCDALTALQRVSLQITHRALGQQHQLILAQVCMAAAPLLQNFTTIEPGQIRSASRLASSSGPAGSRTTWLPTRANQRCRLRSPSARLAFSLSLATKG
jgi:hypothetical protein